LNTQAALQQLAVFNSEQFTPELWNRLASEMKALSANYLAQAVSIARLMERAYAFEIGEPVNLIKPTYTRSDLSGLLAGDFLLRDIDAFTVFRIAQTQKKQPVKEVISLADRFPVQFMRDFQRSGRMAFHTSLSDFDRTFPGSYQHRIRRVELVVEGLIGNGGLHGTLVNTGLAYTRRADGGTQLRLLQPETLILSSYRITADSVVFTPDESQLAIFEGSPTASSWMLELRPAVNDLIYIAHGRPQGMTNAALQEGLKDPMVKQRFAELGATTMPPEKGTPQALQAHLKSEMDKWTPLIKKAGVYAD